MAKKGHYRPRPVTHCACGDHAFANATKGYVVMVSPVDAHLIEEKPWATSYAKKQRQFYAITGDGRPGRPHGATIKLHRVLDPLIARGEGPILDHENRNGLDCRRSNLRRTTVQGNNQNQAGRPGTSSRFRGVHRTKHSLKSPWKARVMIGREVYHIGSFEKEEYAALAVNMLLEEVVGEMACLNTLTEQELHSAKTAITSIQARVRARIDRTVGGASSTRSGRDTGSSRTATRQTRRTIAASM